ncbi:YbaK/EbsC family protein [Pedococcus sp. 5OH_020]|uniref:YbaK/EbsC family protein n=1 Tax=Pedococcus sp. 5OH_020 TaxID=2989814 RepID=UPI0022E9FC40|nr:YbaK/EbsC family protein [Pedococcus sp. 5OH_020]
MSSAEGTLVWGPAHQQRQLLAAVVADAITEVPTARVASIDPTLADTAAFCEAYDVAMEHSANCVVVAGKRAGEARYAAVLVLASMRADINGVVRRHLDVRKISFAPQPQAVALTGMEFGGITPVGLPADWPVLVDTAVVAAGDVVVGSGLRSSKLLVVGADLGALARAEVLDLTL